MKKLNISWRSPGCHETGKAKSNAIGAGPIAGTTIRRPKPGATRYLSVQFVAVHCGGHQHRLDFHRIVAEGMYDEVTGRVIG